jgi:hypothetical protein
VKSGLALDAGALIAFERGNRKATGLLENALADDRVLLVPAGVIGQVWRDGRRQVRLARLLASDGVEIEPLDDRRAREAGMLCGLRNTDDVIDASVVLCARARHYAVVTSDPDDLAILDPRLELIVV